MKVKLHVGMLSEKQIVGRDHFEVNIDRSSTHFLYRDRQGDQVFQIRNEDIPALYAYLQNVYFEIGRFPPIEQVDAANELRKMAEQWKANHPDDTNIQNGMDELLKQLPALDI